SRLQRGMDRRRQQAARHEWDAVSRWQLRDRHDRRQGADRDVQGGRGRGRLQRDFGVRSAWSQSGPSAELSAVLPRRALLVIALAVATAGCGTPPPAPGATAENYVTAVAGGDYAGACAM